MTDQKRIEGVKRGSGHIAKMHGPLPAWVPPPFKKFYDFARKWSKEFNKNLLKDREEELIKEAGKPFKYM
ncbi:hypothetical protein ACFLZ2_03075 [Candidatus Margulisiibacteriota bacterium]